MSAQPAGDDHPDSSEPPVPPREPVFNIAGVVIGFIFVCAAIHVVSTQFLDTQSQTWMLVNLAFIPARYTGGYAFDLAWLTTPFSYSLLHGGYAHLIINMIWLAAFGSPLANRIGTVRFILFWMATAFGAVLLHFAIYPTAETPLVGASGAISGMMGAAARFAFRIDRTMTKPAFAGPVLGMAQVFASRPAVTFLAVWFAINLVTGIGFGSAGMSAQIAWEAHIGGFLVGFFLLRAFDRPYRAA